ncbi:MAG TPA: transcription-repair coupling factor [Limnochordales bacterium]
MDITAIFDLLAESREIRWLRGGQRSPAQAPAGLLHGFTPAHKVLLIAALYREGWPRGGRHSMLVMAAGPHQAERLREDLAALLPEDEVLLFPAREIWPHEELPMPKDLAAARLAVLERLSLGRPTLVVAPVQAAVERLVPREALAGAVRTIAVGDRIRPQALAAQLVQLGYERVDMVDGRGQFSVRGGLIDVFPLTAAQGLRIDFFDDEVDSIRLFDVETQRSSGAVERAVIGPVWELVLPEDASGAAEAIEAAASRQANRLHRAGFAEAAADLRQRVAAHIEQLQTGRRFAGIEQYKAFFYPRLETLVEYVGDGPVVLDEPARTREQLNLFHNDFAHTHAGLLERGRVLPESAGLFADWDDLLLVVRRHPALFTCGLKQHVPGLEGIPELQVASRPAPTFQGKLEPFVEAVRERRRQGWRIVIAAATDERAQRIESVLRDEEIPVRRWPEPGAGVAKAGAKHAGGSNGKAHGAGPSEPGSPGPIAPGSLLEAGVLPDGAIADGAGANGAASYGDGAGADSGAASLLNGDALSAGAPAGHRPGGEHRPGAGNGAAMAAADRAPAAPGRLMLPPGTVTVITANLSAGCELPAVKLLLLTELETFGQRKVRRQARTKSGAGARLDELKVGDLVVHVNHGIGRYMGVETLQIGGVHKDYLVVQYAGDDKLYVPTEQVDLLQKYIGVEGQTPRLSKLGGSDWARVKKRVTESVKELAQGLLKLYAEREALPGYAFSKDTVWQQQFEEAFPYEETPDQWRAIQEVKADMERPRPMDRLLCGDVGFGKTEVAMRAAFKAVMDAKQVAVLVPTTILAQQHLRTFRDRFAAYPVRIEALSRFQSPAEQARILKGLADGTVDIVIGTHRLLSKDVQFKDLGCVIVDEEQRFGVAQKERLKELRRTVDVLTLSATPIPRTLHMALVGVRDMSVIETPPEDRFPIRTYVVEYNEELVREAILRELARGGQVYFVHNRVQDIERFGERLRELVPEARIAIAHGQMDEDLLERVMLDFLNGEIDVLLCSTIIETGMDIANVNTLIVDEADRLGLAQLYQLRGRVGRSNRVAYAYFTYRRDKILTEDAEKRLQAIREFTELGSGFKIALRDLEIRGAGNLLGPEQHGFIASVGFELYCKLLEEAVREVKGEVVQEPPDPVIDLNVDAYVADEYVPDPQRKVEVYKKVVAIRRPEDVADLQEELEDRFGPVPMPVRNLLAVARIKALARELSVASISGDKGEVVIRLLQGVVLPREVALHLTRRFRGRVLLSPTGTALIKLRCRGLGERDVLALLEEVLREMKAAWPSTTQKNQADPPRVQAVQSGRA